MNFQIEVEYENGNTLSYSIPGANFLDAVLNYYKFSELSEPIKSFTWKL